MNPSLRQTQTHLFIYFVVDGEAFQNTSWVDHFQKQSIEIGSLNNELYEFKTVGRNDYPEDNDVNTKTESPASDVTEGRPLPGIVSTYRTSLLRAQNNGRSTDNVWQR